MSSSIAQVVVDRYRLLVAVRRTEVRGELPAAEIGPGETAPLMDAAAELVAVFGRVLLNMRLDLNLGA